MASVEDDINVFLKLGNLFPFIKVCRYPAHPNMVYLEVYEKSFVKDIMKLGLLQNKMLQDSKNKFNIPKLSDSMMNHFIRGFFDADGCVYTPTRYRSRNNIKVEIGLGTKNFCLQLKQLFEDLNFNFTYTVRDKKAGFNDKYYTSHTLATSARKDSLQFADYIYKDATIFLKRKYDKFKIYIKSESQLRRESFPKCSICGGDSTFNGTRDGKQRLKCKNCNKQYSVILPPL
jgi:intein/homing endonuclease